MPYHSACCAIFRCKNYPNAGYPMVAAIGDCPSGGPPTLGWPVMFVFLLVIIMGSFVLPTVLIGIVIVSFDESSKRGTQVDEIMKSTAEVEAGCHVHPPLTLLTRDPDRASHICVPAGHSRAPQTVPVRSYRWWRS